LPHVEVYGVDHSPWVQTVLLGLHEKGVSYAVRTAPPFAVFRKTGILMPGASLDGAAWRLNSYEILEQVGYEPVSDEDLAAIYGAWGGVAHRVDNGPRFWRAFSLIRDPNPSLLARLRNHFLRSFATFYFFLLINVMRRIGNLQEPESFGDQFRHWEQKLEESAGDYLVGAEPGVLDMLLFGIIQCHCSIPVPPIRALQEDPALPRLRAWLGRMQVRFSDYPHLYSGVYFEPRSAAPSRSTRLEQAAFWLGATFMFLAFPITIPLVFFFVSRVQRMTPRRFRPGAATP
jgi:glutathione S-transferase